jgi:hypothetical protein
MHFSFHKQHFALTSGMQVDPLKSGIPWLGTTHHQAPF